MPQHAVSFYHRNVLADGSQVTASGVTTLSSASYVFDNRLSFKFTTSGTGTTFLVDQPSSSIRNWRYLVLMDHNLSGGSAVVTGYPTVARSSPTEVLSTAIPFTDPVILDMGAEQGFQFVDIELTTSGGVSLSVGELGLFSQFEMPQLPGVGITTTHTPRTTFFSLNNGERQAVKHGGVSRIKEFNLPGLTLGEAQSFLDVWTEGEGSELVVLDDDRGDTYPALMNQEVTVDDQQLILNIRLRFEEVNLT